MTNFALGFVDESLESTPFCPRVRVSLGDFGIFGITSGQDRVLGKESALCNVRKVKVVGKCEVKSKWFQLVRKFMCFATSY